MRFIRSVSAVLLVLTIGSLLVQAVSQGPNYASASSTVGWTNSTFAEGTPDSQCASRTSSGGSLDLTNFGFIIPAAAIINGITAEVKFANPNTTEGIRVRVLKGATPSTTSYDILGIPGQTDCSTSAFRTVGSPTDLWGTAWTASDINDPSFGVRLSKLGSSTDTSYVDSVRITIEYTDVMTVVVESGGALSANVASATTVEAGKVEFLGDTTLRVTATKNWRVRATASVTIFPAGADNPGDDAVEIKDYLGSFQPAGPPGVIVLKGTPTSAGGDTFTIDLQVMLDDFSDGKIGSYQFTVNYTIEDDI